MCTTARRLELLNYYKRTTTLFDTWEDGKHPIPKRLVELHYIVRDGLDKSENYLNVAEELFLLTAKYIDSKI